MKFKYEDEVKVVSGFFEGLIGIVTDINRKSFLVVEYGSTEMLDTYYVLLTDSRGNILSKKWIPETELELVK